MVRSSRTLIASSRTYDNRSLQPQTHYDNEYWSGLLGYNRGNFEDVFPNPELIMQENHNNYRPKKVLSGIIDSDSDDSDAESISATSYQETSSLRDSVDSSNRHFPRCSSTYTCKDLQALESQLTCRTTPSKQEVKEVKSKAAVAAIYGKGREDWMDYYSGSNAEKRQDSTI